MIDPIDQAIIIGARFSSYAGLPLQAGFTSELLRGSRFTKGPSKRLVDYLCTFVRETFHLRKELDPGPLGPTSKTSSPA